MVYQGKDNPIFLNTKTVQKVIEIEGSFYVIKENKKSFSKDALIDKIKTLNIKYPHIVLAQSIIETGHWTSNIFKENNSR